MLHADTRRPSTEFGLKQNLNPASPIYTLRGILDYLQSEWTKMEIERSEWAAERAEMQARIASLQAECKGQENLKSDLIRRIKMLEYALLQERSKNFDLKCSSDDRLFCARQSNTDDEHHPLSVGKFESGVLWLQERERLKRYLINAGLELTVDQFCRKKLYEPFPPPVSETLSHSTIQGQSKNFSTFITNKASNVNSCSGDGGDNDGSVAPTAYSTANNDPVPTNLSEIIESLTKLDHSMSILDDSMELTDPETAEAMAEFDLLVSRQGLPNGVGESDHSSTDELIPLRKWSSINEQELLSRFKEQYRAERQKVSRSGDSFSEATKHSKHENVDGDRITLNLDCNLEINDDIDVKRPPHAFSPTSGTCSSSYDIADEMTANFTSIPSANDPLDPWVDMDQPSNNRGSVTCHPNPILDAASVSPSSLGLGDLASLTVANEAESGYTRACLGDVVGSHSVGSTDCTSSTDSSSLVTEETPWTAKYTLRSHFDAIRAISFHPEEPILVTASEDQTLKLWNLNKTVQAKKSTNFDVEPVHTFRGHYGPVLSLAMWSGPDPSNDLSNMILFSGDLHGRLRTWRLSESCSDPYDVFDPSTSGPFLRGHCDAIWSLSVRSDGVLLSASADGTGCLWLLGSLWQSLHTFHSSIPASSVYQLTTNLMTSLLTRSGDFSARAPVPTSTCFIDTDRNHFLCGFTSGHLCLFDLNTNQLVSSFQSDTSTDVGAVSSVVAHSQRALAISGHDDRQIRFFDLHSGKCVHSMVAHLDTVTSLSLDSQGVHLLSSSHDCSIRLWNLNQRSCIQEITSHRKKFGESIHAVTFHPTKHLMASAGADALAKVFT